MLSFCGDTEKLRRLCLGKDPLKRLAHIEFIKWKSNQTGYYTRCPKVEERLGLFCGSSPALESFYKTLIWWDATVRHSAVVTGLFLKAYQGGDCMHSLADPSHFLASRFLLLKWIFNLGVSPVLLRIQNNLPSCFNLTHAALEEVTAS